MEREVKKEIEITDKNYKGYLALYNYKKNPYNDDFELDLFNKIIKSFFKFIGVLALSICFMNASSIFVLVPLFILSYSIGIIFFIKKQYNDYYQENLEKILNEYNIENIKYNYLSKSLGKSKIKTNKQIKIKDNNVVLNNYNYENQKPKVKTYKRK